MQTARCLQLRPARAAAVARPRRACVRSSLESSEQSRCDVQASAANTYTPSEAPQVGPRTATKTKAKPAESPMVLVARSLPRVLVLHTGGTLGMQPESFENSTDGNVHLVPGTGGQYEKALRPSGLLDNLLNVVPELKQFAQLDVKVVFNKDSSNVGPKEWVQLAQVLHRQRDNYEAFMLIHGTDTMSYTASALSLMLCGFRKPIVMTGSQLPLALPRSDARQNLIDSLTCATAGSTPPHVHLQEVTVCFGGKLMRGNRSQKVNSSAYNAFDSPSYPHLASLGVDVEWATNYLLRPEGAYTPRFNLNCNVIRIPIIPGSDPRKAYGDLAARGIRGMVLEAFGTGNMPDLREAGWLPWLRAQRKKGVIVYLSSQCKVGMLHPELYRSGSAALKLGAEAGPQMTPECAVVKLMVCLHYPDLPLSTPLAGEM